MSLVKLLQEIDVTCVEDRIIVGISEDSRKVQADWLFLAHKGNKTNGELFAAEALAKGAVVLWEKETQKNCYHCENLIEAQATLLRIFYQDPCRHLCVIGVTGTNGKTSVSSLMAQILTGIGKHVMLIGTGHVQYDDICIPIDQTTPSACMLATYFSMALQNQISTIVMEVSSHAIDQKRIGFIRFDWILYTNIRSDHLDYHITKTHYQYTKFKLRSYLKQSGRIIVNHDDPYLHPLYDFHDHKIITVGQREAHIQLSDVSCTLSGSTFHFEQEFYHTCLLGIHNVINLAQCLVVLQELQVPLQQKQQIVANLHGIAGRNELHYINHRYVVIDYAHTASSLQTLLQLISDLKTTQRMILICGCGGERDRTKRPQMAQIALDYGDIVIFTMDNPRNEKQSEIFHDMIDGIHGSYEIFENRACAIKYAVKISQEHDIIVIAGKGDEHVQLINGQKIPFSDWTWVQRMIGGFKCETTK